MRLTASFIFLVFLSLQSASIASGINDSRLFILAGADYNVLKIGRDQQVSMLIDGTVNQYNSYKKNDSALGFNLSAGLESPLQGDFALQTSIDIRYSAKVKDRGDVLQFSNAEYNNFVYIFGVNAGRIMLDFKVNKRVRERYFPYAHFGFGVALLKANSYEELPKASGLIPMEPYTDNTAIRSAIQAGLGVDYAIRSNYRLGLGYVFASLGRTALGLSPSQTVASSFHSRWLYANTLSLHLVRLF